jgi:hypothetical protein
MGGVPARARIEDGFLYRCTTCGTLTPEFVSTLGRGAYLDHKTTELGDARPLLGRCGFVVDVAVTIVVVKAEIGARSLDSQLAQQRLHTQVRDVSQAPHVLFLLVELDVAAATGAFKANQEVVDVGGVVGGDAQKLGEYVEPLARGNKGFTQVFARVLADQRDKVEDERLWDPGVVDVVRGDPQEGLGVGRCPAVERDGDLAACVAQPVADANRLILVTLDDLTLDRVRRRNDSVWAEQRTKAWFLDGQEWLIGAHHPFDKALPEFLRREWGLDVGWLRRSEKWVGWYGCSLPIREKHKKGCRMVAE